MALHRKIHSIALSIASAPASNKIRGAVQFASPAEAWNRIDPSNSLTTQSYLLQRYSAKPLVAAEEIFSACISGSVTVLDWWDEHYPPLLREIPHPPLVLYLKGTIPSGEKLAIVGTREADRASRIAARKIASETAAAGFTVVSGMALGIDREAHIGALDGGFPTVGVLANGIDVIYPTANKDLYAALNSSGNSSLISEYPPGIMAGKWTFTRRNRIISGLSRGTVVVMAGERSGALITARFAVEQNREVFACPGPVFDSGYLGCHRLIRDGAVCVSATADILSELEPYCAPAVSIPEKIILTDISRPDTGPAPAAAFADGTLEARILEALADGEIDADALIRSLGENAGPVNEALVNLEFGDHVARNGNMIMRVV